MDGPAGRCSELGRARTCRDHFCQDGSARQGKTAGQEGRIRVPPVRTCEKMFDAAYHCRRRGAPLEDRRRPRACVHLQDSARPRQRRPCASRTGDRCAPRASDDPDSTTDLRAIVSTLRRRSGPYVVETYIKTVLVGQDPFDRERLWQGSRMAARQRRAADRQGARRRGACSVGSCRTQARASGQQAHRQLSRQDPRLWQHHVRRRTSKAVCHAGGLRAFRGSAREARVQGNQAAHLDAPGLLARPIPKMDVKACAAVREAVGPDIALMLDAYHWYSRTDALYLGRELQKLDYAWFEEPMEEASIVLLRLARREPRHPGPRAGDRRGQVPHARRMGEDGACDILRVGVFDVGGIGPGLKVAHLAESFGMNCEIHGGGAGNLDASPAPSSNCDWYERGLLHPFLDYDEPPALPQQHPRPDGPGGLRPCLARDPASARTSTSNTSRTISSGDEQPLSVCDRQWISGSGSRPFPRGSRSRSLRGPGGHAARRGGCSRADNRVAAAPTSEALGDLLLAQVQVDRALRNVHRDQVAVTHRMRASRCRRPSSRFEQSADPAGKCRSPP